MLGWPGSKIRSAEASARRANDSARRGRPVAAYWQPRSLSMSIDFSLATPEARVIFSAWGIIRSSSA